jgi:hypothetical protein
MVAGTVSGFLKDACPAVTFKLGDAKAATSASTVFEGKASIEIKNGDHANAAGTRRSEGALLASKVVTRR